jgi:hypothetical protein
MIILNQRTKTTIRFIADSDTLNLNYDRVNFYRLSGLKIFLIDELLINPLMI